MRELWEHQKYALSHYKDREAFGLLMPCGAGKEQPLSSKVLTADGYLTMGDMRVGTKVVDGNGYECTVTGIYPQGVKPVYKIAMSDGTHIRVGKEHLNRFIRHSRPVCHKAKDAGIYKMDLTTEELIEQFSTGRYDFWCQLPVCVFRKKELPVDPYLLGVLIGDGCLCGNKSISVTLCEQDMYSRVSDLVGLYGCTLRAHGHKRIDYRISRLDNSKKNSLVTILNELGLRCRSFEKHIPHCYLYSSVDDRLLLLQGLFDTDGYVNVRAGRHGKLCCYFEWGTTSKQLSEDFSFLARSLGCVSKVSVKRTHYMKDGVKVPCRAYYRHYIKVPNGLAICSSLKHSAKVLPRQHEPMRKVVSIEPDGTEECQCIMVDSPDHTYITDSVTVTHNTQAAARLAEAKGRPVLIIAPNALCQQWADELTNHDEATRITKKDWQVVVCTSRTKNTKKFREALDSLKEL